MVRQGQVKPVVAVTGPTASGKSDAAVLLAAGLSGEVINIDSVQVYRGLDTGSAKTPLRDRGGIPHHLIDIRNPDEGLNVSWFMEQAYRTIEEVNSRRKLCVLAGGTGMYLTLLFHGLARLPEGNAGLRSELLKLSGTELHDRLSRVDPEAAAGSHPNDRIRMERALEVFELSGVPASEARAAHAFGEAPLAGVFIVLCWARDVLYRRIDERAQVMFDAGIVDETRGVIDRYGDSVFALKAIGYAQAAAVLRGEMTYEQAVEITRRETRNFAKRQCTFWRNEPRKRGWSVHPSDGEEGIELRSSDAFYATHRRVSDFRAYDFSSDEVIRRLQQRLHEPFERNEVWYLNAERLLR